MFKNLVAAAAIAIAALTLPASTANATTVVACGDAVSIGGVGDDTSFIGLAIAGGGVGSCAVTFSAASDPIPGDALATIGAKVFGTFTGLKMSWVSIVNGVLFTTPITVTTTTLSTLFTGPGDLVQYLEFAWTGSKKGAGFDFEVTVEPIPLPLPIMLLGTALLGMGALGRRRKAAK